MRCFKKILLIVALLGLMAVAFPAEANVRIDRGRGQKWNLDSTFNLWLRRKLFYKEVNIMLTFEERKTNILRKSRLIGDQEYGDDEILKLLREGSKRGIVDKLSPIAAESRLKKGMELGPIPGFSNRDIETEVLKCLEQLKED
jgi:hypothetical protein